MVDGRSKVQVDTSHWFEIDGWNGPQPSHIVIHDQAEIALSRKIIAHEVAQFESRLEELDKRINSDDPAHKAAQKSKHRPSFDVQIKKRHDAPKSQFTSGLNVSAAAQETPRPLRMGTTDWLRERFPGGGYGITVGAEVSTRLVKAIKATNLKVHQTEPGEGAVTTTAAGMVDRYRSSKESFATWLSSVDQAGLHSVSCWVFGRDATLLDIDLLRYTLAPHQVVIIDKTNPRAADLYAAWDGTTYDLNDAFLLTDPGADFVDPMLWSQDIVDAVDWPKISVVTVSYNQSAYLEDCLTSVLNQQYPNLEYIVIDAESTDGSQDILQRFAPKLDKLVIEPDEGQSDGLNKGFDLSTGDILTWINSDDMLAPGSLRRAALTFLRYGCDLVAGGCERMTENSDEVITLHHSATPYMRKVPLGFSENLIWCQSWEKGDYFFQPEVFFTADIWRRAGGYLKKHLYWAMDWELWIRMGMAGAEIVHIPMTIGRSREHPDQKTTGEELYLYQLKNILLEYDDALKNLQRKISDLPAGKMRDWPPSADLAKIKHALPPNLAQRAFRFDDELLERVKRLKNPRHLKAVVAARAPIVPRLWRLRDPVHLKRAAAQRLSPKAKSRLMRLKGVLKAERYAPSMPRLVSGSKFAKLKHAQDTLIAYEAETRAARTNFKRLQSEHEVLQKHAKELGAAKIQEFEFLSSTLGNVNTNLSGFLGKFLFGRKPDPISVETLKTLVQANTPIEDIVRTLAIQGYQHQSAPSFANVRPFLKREQKMPALTDVANEIELFRVVDIGAEKLAFEDDAYAKLSQSWATSVVGFDPFMEVDAASDDDVPVDRATHDASGQAKAPQKADSAVVSSRLETTMLPYFIGDGSPAKFHVNKMRATSSLLAANQQLASKFSLLGEALTADEELTVETHRLDDVMNEHIGKTGSIDFLKVDVQGATHSVLDGAAHTLSRTVVCQLEAEFSQLYENEVLFAKIDATMRGHGFGLVDFATLGRQRYKSFDPSPSHMFHTSRLLWADCVYVRNLDSLENFEPAELLKLSVIAHEIYQKYDLAMEALEAFDEKAGSTYAAQYLDAMQ